MVITSDKFQYKYFDVRVKLQSSGRVVSMVPPYLTTPDTSVIILTDPEKLKSVVNEHNQGKHVDYLFGKAKGSLSAILAATSKTTATMPAPSANFKSLEMPTMNFWQTKSGQIIGDIQDGATRIANLIRLNAYFIPIITGQGNAELAHKLIGNDTPPIPVTSLLVSIHIREECEKDFPYFSRAQFEFTRRKEQAAERLAHSILKKNPIQDYRV